MCNAAHLPLASQSPSLPSGFLPPAPLCSPQSAEPHSSAKKTARASRCPESVTGSLTVSTAVMKSSAKKVDGSCSQGSGVAGSQVPQLSSAQGSALLSTYPSTLCAYVSMSIHPLIYLPIHPSTYLSIIQEGGQAQGVLHGGAQDLKLALGSVNMGWSVRENRVNVSLASKDWTTYHQLLPNIKLGSSWLCMVRPRLPFSMGCGSERLLYVPSHSVNISGTGCYYFINFQAIVFSHQIP